MDFETASRSRWTATGTSNQPRATSSPPSSATRTGTAISSAKPAGLAVPATTADMLPRPPWEFIGEGAGVFPHHEWQNRKAGAPNDLRKNNFSDMGDAYAPGDQSRPT
ncbi:hypothetical protein ARTHRO9V_200182 [Arthrobacter sp. 9V]|nr:hypothetical protein ARTHRO9V_200182 [Arthrobacter sp. 9V]